MIGKRTVEEAEYVVEEIHRRSKRALPHLAHLFLVATFFEDGLRMVYQWEYQRNYMNSTWDCGYFLASSFVLINSLTQLSGSLMITVRYHVKLACILLGISVVIQTLGYSVFRDQPLFIRFFSLIGSLMLLYTEAHIEAKQILAGVPSLGIDHPKSYMQLSGRILVALLFVTSLRMESTVFQVSLNVVASIMMTLVSIGYRTKLSATVLAAWLFVVNMHSHPFWTRGDDIQARESLKYEFFQNISVIGGLLLLVSQGPGHLSVDARKKHF